MWTRGSDKTDEMRYHFESKRRTGDASDEGQIDFLTD